MQKNSFILQYPPIVRKAVVQPRGMTGSLLQEEGLVDQGVIALVECLERYDESRGAKFETYAFLEVWGAMIDYIRSQDWVPHRARNSQKKVNEACAMISNEKAKEADAQEVTNYLDIPVEKVENHIQYMNHVAVLSFENVLQDTTGLVAKEELEAEDISTKPEGNLFYRELQKQLAAAVGSLDEKERLVISLRYYRKLKCSEIAEILGIGQSRVCQIHTKAIGKLRASMKEYMKG